MGRPRTMWTNNIWLDKSEIQRLFQSCTRSYFVCKYYGLEGWVTSVALKFWNPLSDVMILKSLDIQSTCIKIISQITFSVSVCYMQLLYSMKIQSNFKWTYLKRLIYLLSVKYIDSLLSGQLICGHHAKSSIQHL